jgi:NitT/TauT family transport system substrate-binding protein
LQSDASAETQLGMAAGRGQRRIPVGGGWISCRITQACFVVFTAVIGQYRSLKREYRDLSDVVGALGKSKKIWEEDMRKLYPTLAVIAAAAFVLPGAAVAQNNKLIVAMPTTPPNVVHMPVLIAKELGLYKGIEVSTINLEGGVYTYRATVAGSADVALAGGAFSIVGKAKGAPTKLILANAPKLEASMVVNKDIKILADIKGKRIGIQEPGGFADVLSRGVLRVAKIDPKEVNFVSIASEDVPALVADQVDTAILHVEQVIVAQSKLPSLHAVAQLWEIQPKNLNTVMAVTEKTIAEKRAALQAFVKANIEATRLIYTDRAKVLPAIIKHTQLPKDVAEKTLDYMIKNCIWDANSGLGPTRINFTAELMEKVGNIAQGKVPKYEELVDLSFANDAIKELGEWKGPNCPSDN